MNFGTNPKRTTERLTLLGSIVSARGRYATRIPFAVPVRVSTTCTWKCTSSCFGNILFSQYNAQTSVSRMDRLCDNYRYWLLANILNFFQFYFTRTRHRAHVWATRIFILNTLRSRFYSYISTNTFQTRLYTFRMSDEIIRLSFKCEFRIFFKFTNN